MKTTATKSRTPLGVFMRLIAISAVLFGRAAFANDEAITNCYEQLKPGATFTATWSNNQESGTLGFVVDSVDQETDTIKGKLYEPLAPRKTRPFVGMIKIADTGVVLTLQLDAEGGLIEKRCTTPTSTRFLRKGYGYAIALKLEDGNWVSASNDTLEFRSRGVGNYAQRLEAYNAKRKELDEKFSLLSNRRPSIQELGRLKMVERGTFPCNLVMIRRLKMNIILSVNFSTWRNHTNPNRSPVPSLLARTAVGTSRSMHCNLELLNNCSVHNRKHSFCVIIATTRCRLSLATMVLKV
ncbi:MAG: hypothetical protein ACRC46_04610 [Thermoguttaceae bacterium]